MIERASPLETVAVNQAQGMARPVAHTAMRAALGVFIVLTAAFWYAKTAIFIAFAGGRTSKGGLD